MEIVREIPRNRALRFGLTTGDVAKQFNVTRQTIIRCCEKGNLKFHRVLGSKHRRITPEDLLRYMREQQFPEDGWEDFFNPRILVISTDVALKTTLQNLLSDRACRVEFAESGLDAGIKIGEHKPACIIVDFKMGPKVAISIASRIRDCPRYEEVVLIGLSRGKRVDRRINLSCFDQMFDLIKGQEDLANFIMKEPYHA